MVIKFHNELITLQYDDIKRFKFLLTVCLVVDMMGRKTLYCRFTPELILCIIKLGATPRFRFVRNGATPGFCVTEMERLRVFGLEEMERLRIFGLQEMERLRVLARNYYEKFSVFFFFLPDF